jgi:4-amino-4-deoxy-L-arabinose transferase-like glycosyltransferase
MTTMNTTRTIDHPQAALSTRTVWLVFAVVWVTIYFASLFSPPLMDDVDAAHAQAAQHMAESGDLITAKTNGIRYIEKPPLPYWMIAGMYKIFGQSTFATHLPNALAMLGLTWLAWLWARRAWGERAGFYAGLAVLTSAGCFLFTRFIIPEAILALFLLIALYALIVGLEDNRPAMIYWMWAGVALALLTKGLIAPVFFFGAAIPYLLLTGQWRRWKALKPVIWTAGVSGDRGTVAHCVRHHQSRPGTSRWQPPDDRQCAWIFLPILHQRTRAALLQHALPARLQQDADGVWYWLGELIWIFPWSLFLGAVVRWRGRRGAPG